MSEKMQDTSKATKIWRTGGGDNERRGLFPDPVQLDPKPLQALPAQGSVQASVVFDRSGSAYIADMLGGVQSYSADFKERWRTRLEGGVSAAPVVHPDDRRLYVGTHAGWIYALDASNGEPIWKKEIPSKSDPRILSDLLYLASSNALVLSSWGGRFLALNADDGQDLFSWNAGISPDSAASADSRGVIYSLRAIWDQGVQLTAVSSSGSETILYTQPLEKRPANRILVSAAPVIDEERGVLYMAANVNQESLLHAWHIQSGKTVWSRRFPRNIIAEPTLLQDGALAVSCLDGFVYALSSENELRFRYASDCEYLLSSSVSAGGEVFVGDPLGWIHQIEPTGAGRAFFESPRAIQSRPSLDSKGRLFVPSTDRSVYVFNNTLI
ncbi:MAG: PQQ-binding-like beta-propeller repeat protein [Candidatus Omnitrophica bacterium]|nr:PQQ-binding-like beta-propeller repeat protein [Candidatus Omnitrophota bacterium]